MSFEKCSYLNVAGRPESVNELRLCPKSIKLTLHIEERGYFVQKRVEKPESFPGA